VLPQLVSSCNFKQNLIMQDGLYNKEHEVLVALEFQKTPQEQSVIRALA
jgi:hypothetical protein